MGSLYLRRCIHGITSCFFTFFVCVRVCVCVCGCVCVWSKWIERERDSVFVVVYVCVTLRKQGCVYELGFPIKVFAHLLTVCVCVCVCVCVTCDRCVCVCGCFF